MKCLIRKKRLLIYWSNLIVPMMKKIENSYNIKLKNAMESLQNMFGLKTIYIIHSQKKINFLKL